MNYEEIKQMIGEMGKANFEELNILIREIIDNGLRDKLLIPSIVKSEPIEKVVYENLTLDISRDNVSEDRVDYNLEYKNKLNDLINFRNSDNIDDEILEEVSEVVTVSEEEKLPELYPVGLLHGTYIVCENERGIYLIDQHAAKERINYEKMSYLLSHPSDSTISPLVSMIIELPRGEYLNIKDNMDIIDGLNISLEEFGQSSYRVVSHPTWFTQGKEEDIVREIFDLVINKGKDFSIEKFNDNLAKMVSCKMSIKANTYVDKASMERLIDDLRKCKNPYNCPHGRPAIIHFSIYELEKMFKRSI